MLTFSRQGLVTTLRDQPNDCLARLALADLCDEEGQEKLARCQRWLANLGHIKKLSSQHIREIVDDYLYWGNCALCGQPGQVIRIRFLFDEELAIYSHQTVHDCTCFASHPAFLAGFTDLGWQHKSLREGAGLSGSLESCQLVRVYEHPLP